MATAGTVVGTKKRDIFDLANICEDLFSRYADPNLPLPEPKARADLQQQRFEVWASYLGVFAPYDVSLDRRLEYSEEIRNLVMQLLSLMRRNLDFVLLESHKELSLGSSDYDVKGLDAKPRLKGTASEALDAIEATINRLNRLGSTIRRYSTSSLETRVRAFTARYGDENYTTLAKLIVQFKYMTAPSSLQEQLAVSMSARRQRLRYMCQHQAKLASREQKTQKKQQDQPDMRTALSPALEKIAEEEDSENATPPEPMQNRKRVFHSSQNNPFVKMFAPSDMGSKASTFKPPPTVVARLQRGDGASVVSSSKNSKTFMAEDLENYPEAPQRESGKPAPSCPFCSKPLEDSELKLGKWQRHVNRDLQPFVCISENCSEPPKSFDDFYIWAEHMRDSHSNKWTQQVHKPVIWRCDLYHEEEEFAEEGRFEEHLTSKHANSSTTERKAISRSSKSTRRRRPNICPLCGYDVFVPNSTNPAPLTQKDSTSNPTNSGKAELLHKLAKHIAGHLRLLAFSSADNLDAGSDDSSQGSMKTLDMKTRDGSKTHPPSGMKDLSRGHLSFIDDPNELGDATRQSLGHVNASKDMDPDWSTEEIASLNVGLEELYPTEGLSWTKVKEILKVDLKSHILADLEHRWPQESPDLILQHIYQHQANSRETEDESKDPADAQPSKSAAVEVTYSSNSDSWETEDKSKDSAGAQPSKSAAVEVTYSSDSDSWETEDEPKDPAGAQPSKSAAVEALPLLPVPGDVSQPGDKLCDVCAALSLEPRRFVVLPGDKEWNQLSQPDDDVISLDKVEDMRKKTGCPMCRLVLVAIGGSKVPTHEDADPVCVTLSWNTDGPLPDPRAPWSHRPEIRILRPYVRKQSGGFISKRLNLFPEITLLANDSPTDSTIYFVRPISLDKIDFTVVRRWLALCDARHGKACRRNPVLKELKRSHPTKEVPSFRCIDVEQNCVVILPSACRYAALSYVWGRKKFFATLTTNVKDLEEPQSLSKPEYLDQIPPTIKDAIHVTKEIGFRYLWVDNLCIVQNDPDQKSQTIKTMDLVYSAADLVIVAAGSVDAYAGISGCHIGTRGPRQPIEELAPGFRLAFKERWQDGIDNAAYYTRAWTFQETHFATRSLVFIDGKVVFRCQGVDVWQENVFEAPDEIKGQLSGRGAYEGDDIGEFEGLIQTYSERVLSYEEDIYSAFAGVSRQIMFRFDTDLCHGIPTVCFDWFLLWGPLSDQVRRVTAPSWSWAGWRGGSFPRIWDWYNRSIQRIKKAIRKRTWIIWYQRATGSIDCRLLVRHAKDEDTDGASALKANKNFYGSRVGRRFDMDCSKREPTKVVLEGLNPPTYTEDILSNHKGSGFLQFWTVSLTLQLAEPTSSNEDLGPAHKRHRLGIFGRGGRELGTVSVHQPWLESNPLLPQEREFILLCEGRDKRAEGGRIDDEEGWRYMALLIEWRGENGARAAMGSIDGGKPMYAERVALGSIGKEDLKEALGDGPVWKEIILG